MTTEHQASRTLVKSPPELWAECSDAEALARHIGEFGEIRITRLEPETSVAWEGERASGTVVIEPSGWGTRVTLTALTRMEEAIDAEAVDPPSAECDRVQEDVDPPSPEHDPVQEEADAKVEEAVSESDLALADDAGPPVGRWKRLMGRTRAWFMPTISELEMVPIPPLDADPPEEEPEFTESTEAPEASEPVDPEATTGVGSAVDREATTEAGSAVDREATTEAGSAVDPEAILTAALESLGQAHHRPFSRA